MVDNKHLEYLTKDIDINGRKVYAVPIEDISKENLQRLLIRQIDKAFEERERDKTFISKLKRRFA